MGNLCQPTSWSYLNWTQSPRRVIFYIRCVYAKTGCFQIKILIQKVIEQIRGQKQGRQMQAAQNVKWLKHICSSPQETSIILDYQYPFCDLGSSNLSVHDYGSLGVVWVSFYRVKGKTQKTRAATQNVGQLPSCILDFWSLRNLICNSYIVSSLTFYCLVSSSLKSTLAGLEPAIPRSEVWCLIH